MGGERVGDEWSESDERCRCAVKKQNKKKTEIRNPIAI